MQVRASRHSPGTAYGRGTQAMNKTLSFHEQTGILIPGAALVFALLFFFPEFRQLFFSDGVSIGGLGLFLLISYAAGHLAAALGNVLEAILWPLAGGRPSSWVVKPQRSRTRRGSSFRGRSRRPTSRRGATTRSW